MTNSQHEAMIKFTFRMESAYRAAGKTADADAAALHRANLENMSVCDSCGEWIVTADTCPECGSESNLSE